MAKSSYWQEYIGNKMDAHGGEFSNREVSLEAFDFFYDGSSVDDNALLDTLVEHPRTNLWRHFTKSSVSESLDKTDLIMRAIKAVQEQSDDELDFDEDATKQRLNSFLYSDDMDRMENDLNDKNAILSALGCSHDDADKDGSVYALRKEFMDMISNNSNIRNLLKLVGKFSAMITRMKRKRRVYARAARSEVTTGDDLSKLLMTEAARLVDDDFELLQLYKFSQRNLLQFDNYTKQEAGNGPVWFMIDKSGSMDGSYAKAQFFGEQYSHWEIALASTIGMVKHLDDQGRDWRVSSFNTHVVDFDNSSFLNFVKQAVQSRTSGGTRILYCLKSIFGYTDESYDIVLVTDAEDVELKHDGLTSATREALGDRSLTTLHISGMTDYIDAVKGLSDIYINGATEESFKNLTYEVCVK